MSLVRIFCAGVILAILPSMVRAEVAVQLDRRGAVKNVVTLFRTSGPRPVIWGQVRGRVPMQVMLNPLGDTYGDLAPTLAINPVTGRPWAVWPRNEGNQKRLVFSAWDGKGWTAPLPVAQPDILGYDQLEPRLVFDAAGVPYLVFTEAAPRGRVLFVTVTRGQWAPPLLLSDKGVDSRQPLTSLEGPILNVAFSTAAGPVEQHFPTSFLLDSAANLMDSPIPPGLQQGPGNSGNTSDSPSDPLVHRK